MISRAAGEEFATEPGFVVDLKHVDAGVRNGGGNERRNGFLPGGKGLAGETGDKVKIDVGKSGCTKSRKVVEDNGAGVEATTLAGFAIDERLDTEADAVDADASEGGHSCIGELPGGAFDGDLSIEINGELGADRFEELVDEIGFQQTGGSAAEIDGIDACWEVSAVFCPFAGLVHLSDEALNVPLVFMGRKHPRGKIAVRTLRAAERNGNIKAEFVAAGYRHI
jgi:hypothetical protein